MTSFIIENKLDSKTQANTDRTEDHTQAARKTPKMYAYVNDARV